MQATENTERFFNLLIVTKLGGIEREKDILGYNPQESQTQHVINQTEFFPLYFSPHAPNLLLLPPFVAKNLEVITDYFLFLLFTSTSN